MKRFSYLLFAVLFGVMLQFSAASAQAIKTKIDPKSLPSMLKADNAGTEFIFSLPPCYDVPGQNFIRLYVSSGVVTEVTVKANGFTRQKKTIANGVIEFELSPAMAQAYLLPGSADAPPEQVWPEAAVQVTSGAPIIVYAVTRFQYTSDGFLAIPVSALGKEYVVASYPDMTAMYPGLVLPSLTTITAAYDATKVRFTLGGNTVTRTSGGMRPGQTKEFTMNRGDVVVVSSKGDEADMSGSKVVANKPVAVTSGNMCANVPTQSPWCDFMSEMELPTFTWGKEYHVTKFINRQYNSIIRIYARENNTIWRLNGKDMGVIAIGGGGKKGDAWTEYRVPGPASNNVISADKPIYVVMYNTGQSDDNVVSDPFQLVLTPLEQYQKEITFCTPGIRGGVGFARNYVNVVCPLTQDNLIPDDIEFAKVDEFTGQFVWKKLTAEFGGNIGGKFPVLIAGKPYTSKILTLPGDGVYKIRSKTGENKFAAYAYGFSDYDSYGFPTSVALGNLLDPVAPILEWSMDCEGTVEGLVTDLPMTPNKDTIRTNIARIEKDLTESNNYNLTNEAFVTGEQQRVKWKLTVIDPSQPAKATLHFQDQAGNQTDTVITYEPPPLRVENFEVKFDLVKKNSNPGTKQLNLKNLSAEKPATITDIKINPNDKFTLTDNLTFPITLAPLESKSINISFNTSEVGEFMADVEIKTDCPTLKAKITGAVAVPKIDVTNINFGRIPLGQSKEDFVIVKNVGILPLTISGYTGPDKPEFTTIAGKSDWSFTTVTIEPGKEIQFMGKFTPTSNINYSTRVTFTPEPETEGKNFSIWNGSATDAKLIADGYDWQRRRTLKGPYEATIKVRNEGNTDLTLRDVAIVNDNSKGAFTIEGHGSDWTAAVQGKVVPQNGEVEFKVFFDPKDVGAHSLTLVANSDDATKSTPEFMLEGFGTRPELTVTDVSFGTMNAGDPVESLTMTIHNKDGITDNYAYYADVEITSLSADDASKWQETAGAISGSLFRYVKDTYFGTGKTITIPAGGDAKITVDFNPATANGYTLNVTPVTDNDKDVIPVVSKWTALVKGLGLDPRPIPISICPGSEGTVRVDLLNTGGADVTVSNIKITNISAGASVVSNYDTGNPITIQPGELGKFTTLTVSGTGNVKHTATLMAYFNGDRDSMPATVEFTTESYNRTSSIPKTQATVAQQNLLEVPIVLDAGEDFTNAKDEKNFSITLNFPTEGLLKFERVQASMAGWNVDNVSPVDYANGRVSFVINSNTALATNASGELARAFFRVLLPEKVKGEDAKKYVRQFTHTITSNSPTSCLVITPKPGDVEIDPVCANDMRLVRVGSVPFNLVGMNPNPVSGDNADIQFAVGLSVNTEIVVFNAMGAEVYRFQQNNLAAGEYKITVPVRDLPSGVYTYRMTAGPYNAEQQMIIAK